MISNADKLTWLLKQIVEKLPSRYEAAIKYTPRLWRLPQYTNTAFHSCIEEKSQQIS